MGLRAVHSDAGLVSYGWAHAVAPLLHSKVVLRQARKACWHRQLRPPDLYVRMLLVHDSHDGPVICPCSDLQIAGHRVICNYQAVVAGCQERVLQPLQHADQLAVTVDSVWGTPSPGRANDAATPAAWCRL